MVEFNPQLIVSLIGAILSVFIAGVLTITGWYFRKYVISQVEKNSAMRRYLVGEERLDMSEGELTIMDTKFEEMLSEQRADHEEVRQWLLYLSNYIDQLATALETHTEAEIEPPNGRPPDPWGGSDGSE